VIENLSVQGAPLTASSPVVIGASVGPLFGFYHPAEGPIVRSVGVVLCNPLGYEAMCVHRAYRSFAERLAARGFAALRFDYQGTGDSSGAAGDPGRVNAWLASIDAAIDDLRERAGVRAIALFGVRFGATLAAAVAARRGDIDGLVLWAPSPSGRTYVRELRAFRLIKQPGSHEAQQDADEEAAGYRFDKATVSDLNGLDLLAAKERVAARVLIVPRDDIPGGEGRLAKHFGATGADVELASEPGYADMMRDAQDTVVPSAALDKMIAWLEVAKYPEAHHVGAPRSVRNVLASNGSSLGPPIRELYVRFGEGQRLFGIVNEPTGGSLRPGRPAVLFLNVGANHRVGPNRMYVSLARELASAGHLGFRFDVAGLGDSKNAPGAQENRLYSKDSVKDVKAAMTYLGERFGASRFVLVGLCSGAYLAFHTCVEDDRVVGQVLLNPQTFEWKEGDSLELSMRKSFLSTRYYARALLNPAVWKRAARGKVNVRGVLGVLGERLVAHAKADLARVSAGLMGGREPQTDIERAFHAISKRGVDSLLVFSFMDGGLDMIEKHLGRGVRKMRSYKNFRFEIVEGADHTFTPIESQSALHKLLTRHVTTHFT
jgi:pimeloyl-ACP methyl ester carboxylesterase